MSLAAAILEGGSECLKPPVTLVMCLLAMQSTLLCLGFLTPVVSIAACGFELTYLFTNGSADWRFIVLASLNAFAIALLGPGAYSIDARLFGRRVIVISPVQDSDLE
jgi:uncharacterized membrane protein YphA (DoxX/SURF4 family)